MTRQEFQALCAERILYLDGATGSNLMKAGMPAGVCPELWILDNPEVLIDLQKRYIAAGSDFVLAPTFTGNRIKLKEYGLEDRIEELNHRLVEVSKKACEGRAFVLGDLTMTGKQLKPIGPLDFEELIEVYKEQIRYIVDAGVDALMVETMMSLQETRACVIAAKEVCDLPILATLTFESDGKTLFGTDAKSAAVALEALKVDAIGLNCSTGPDKMIPLVKDFVEYTRLPIIAKPNAGLPYVNEQGETAYNMSAEEFAKAMQNLVDEGATILGGCCGTSPEYIKGIYDRYHTVSTKRYTDRLNSKKLRVLSSERKTFAFELGDPFHIIGERINPTGKKKFQENIRSGNYQIISEFAEEQEAAGAAILDVNMGMSGIDEKEMMLYAMDQIANVTSLPLCLDSSHVDVIEACLRRYPGRALINSISLESIKCRPLLELAAKYGAMFILLPLSDEGLPQNLEERIANIEKLHELAKEYGLSKEDFIVDGLVATVGANKEAARETLATISYCYSKEYATACGLSNISFGLPERGMVNGAFATMAIASGLTMAILNPMQEALMDSIYASDILQNKPGADIRYIEWSAKRKEQREEKEALAKAGEEALKGNNPDAAAILTKKSGNVQGADNNFSKAQAALYKDVLKGYQDIIVEDTKKALDEGEDAQVLLNEVLITGINEVGKLFDQGKYFLPQLISSAEAMKRSIEVLEPILAASRTGDKLPTIVIATVEGDIHDIGKNLVAMMLKNYGFNVIDLGKDVSREVIVDTAIKEDASIIGLSALMTTTMHEMKNVIELAKQKNVKAKIIVGGAVITQDYADEIGADGYSKDASAAVKLVKQLLGMEE